MSNAHASGFSLIAIAVLCLAVGCQGTALAPNSSDALRAQIRDLSEKATMLETRRSELDQQLAQCLRDSQSKTDTDPEVLAATPFVAVVQVGASSHYLSSPSCTALVYLDPSDGLGRFTQVVGRVRVSIFSLSATGESETIGTAEYSPSEVREAWRGGVMGTHYTFEIPLAGSKWTCHGSATVRLEFTDGTTGRSFNSQREINLQK